MRRFARPLGPSEPPCFTCEWRTAPAWSSALRLPVWRTIFRFKFPRRPGRMPPLMLELDHFRLENDTTITVRLQPQPKERRPA